MISNALTLDWPTDDPAGTFLSEARVPFERLPLFLHEVTHWQCFKTAVGSAFRSLWDVLLAASKNTETVRAVANGRPPEALRRILRNLNSGLRLYRPWMEGLALFAEWDALPGKSVAASQAMINASSLHIRTASRDTTSAYQELADAIIRARTGTRAERGKIDLLALRLAGKTSHYLSGYLGVKALYRRSAAASQLLEDSDFFISFASARIYHDPLAAGMLMDIYHSDIEWLNNIRARLFERIDGFYATSLHERASQYEEFEGQFSLRRDSAIKSDLRTANFFRVMNESTIKDLAEYPPGHELFDQSMELTKRDWNTMTLVETYTRSKFSYQPATASDGQWLYVQMTARRHRSMIRLRRLYGNAIFEADNVVLLDKAGQVAAQCRRVEGASLEEEEAIYVLYFDPTAQCLIRLVHMMGEKTGTIVGFEVFAARTLERDQIRLLKDSILAGERHEYFRSRPGGMDEIMKVIDRSLSKSDTLTIEEIARDLALFPVEQSLGLQATESFIERSSTKRGLFGWLGLIGPVADAVGKLSLLASRGLTMSEIRNAMSGDDVTAELVLERLDQISTKENVSLYEIVVSGESERLLLAF